MANDYLEKYLEKKKQEQEGQQSQPSGGNASYLDAWKRSWTQKNGERIGNDLVNRVNSWISKVNSFGDSFTARQKQYGESYQGDASAYLHSVMDQRHSLIAEEKEIRELLKKYSGVFDAKWIKELDDVLTSGSAAHANVLMAAEKNKKYWQQFSSQNDYDWYRKYSPMSMEELYSALGGLEVGSEEYNYVHGRASYNDGWLKEDGVTTVENSAARQARYKHNTDTVAKLTAEYDALYEERKKIEYQMNFGTPEHAARVNEVESRMKQIKAQIDALSAENNRYSQGQGKVDPYFGLTQNDDFADTPRVYDNITREELDRWDDIHNGTPRTNGDGKLVDIAGNVIDDNWIGYQQPVIEDKLGMFLATDQDTRLQAYDEAYEGTWATVIRDGVYRDWDKLTKNEIGIYYYLLAHEGRDSAYRFLDSMTSELNRRTTAEMAERIQNANGWEKLAWNIASVPANVLGGGMAFIDDTINTIKGEEINPYSKWHSAQNAGQTVRSATAEDINRLTNAGESDAYTWGEVYQSIMSGVDNIAGLMTFGKGYRALMTMGAASAEAKELYERGASKEQIAWGGVLAGAAELVFEKISIGFFFDKLLAGGTKSGAQLIRNLLIQGGVEASEEMLTEIANTITDAMVMGSRSEFEQSIQEYMEQGYTRAEASSLAVQKVGKNVWKSGIGGLISGGFMGGGASAAQYGSYKAEVKDTGRTIMSADGGVDALKNLANQVAGVSEDTKVNSKLTKQLSKVDKKATAKNVGNLYNTVQTANDLANAAANQADIAKSLQRKGFGADTAKDIAGALVARYNGQELTRHQEKLLKAVEGNEVVSKAVSDIMANEKSTMGQRSQNIRDFQSDIALGTAINTMAKQHTEKAFTPEGKYAVSPKGEATAMVTEEIDGKTVTKDSGEVIDIKGIKEIHNGRMLLDIGEGKTIDAKSVSFASESDALIYEAIAELGDNIDADTANKLMAKFDGGNAMVFARGIAQAYTYGFYGLDRAEMRGKHTLSAELTEAQRNEAYALGEKYRPVKDAKDKAAAKATKASGEKGVYYRDKDGKTTDIRTHLDNTKIGLKDVQKTAIEVMEKMSQMMGVRFNVFESWVENGKQYYLDENGVKTEGNPNGFYDTRTGEIYIDLNAGNDYQGTMLFTIAHELTHFMRQWSPEHFTKIAKIVFQHGGMKGDVSKLVALKQAKAKARGKPISYDTAMEEVVADGMETILKDGKVLEFMEDVKKKDHAAWEKIKEWFQNLAAFLREMVSAYSGQSAQTVEGAKVAEFSSQILNQIEQIWAEGAVAAGESYQAAKENVTDAKAEKNTTQEGGVKFMSREETTRIKAQIMAVSDQLNQMDVVASITTDGFVGMQKSSIAKAVEAEYAKFGKRVDRQHFGIILLEFNQINKALEYLNTDGEKAALLTVPRVLKRGIVADQHTEHKARAVDSITFAAPVEINGRRGNVGVVVQRVSGTNRFKTLRILLPNGKAFEFVQNKEADSTTGSSSKRNGLEGIPIESASKNSIRNEGKIVNRESAEAMDVELDTKTESVAPAVLKSERTRKEIHKDAVYLDAVNRGDMKIAQKMVDEAARAAGYTIKAYHGTDADAFNVFDKGKFGQATGVGILGDGFYFADSKKIAQKYGKNVYTVYLKQMNPYAATDSDAYQLRSVSIERQGHDSVVLPTGNGKVYMVLDPNQIKSAEPVTYDDSGNVIPLSERFNEAKTDIRYSDRGYSYAALVNKPDMVVTNVDGNVPTNRADVVYWAKQNAAKVGKVNPKDGSVSVRVDDIGADVLLGTKGLEHGLRRLSASQTDPTWRITLKAGEIIKNAIRINEVTPSKEEASGAYVLIGTANNKAGDFYIVRFVVNQYSHELASMDVLYAINAKKEDRLRSMRPGFQGPVTDPKISIADLLDIVNQHFPDILPEDVLKHYGYDARPEGDLGQDALYQDRDTESVSNRALLANALEGLAKDETERTKIQEYKGKIDFVNAEERKLRDLNEQIKELSFAKGPRDTAKIRQLRDEATKTANRISIYDKQLLRLEASAPLQKVLEREKKKAYQRAEKKGKEALAEYKAETLVKGKIKNFKAKLERTLLRPTDRQYVPIDLIKAMVEVCELIDTDTNLYKADGSINKAQQKRNETKEKLQNLKDEYEKLKTNSDPIYAGEFDEMVYTYLAELRDKFSGKSIKDMSLDDLSEMYEILVAIDETLRDARKLIGWGDAENVYEAGDAIVAEQRNIADSRKNGKRNIFGRANDSTLNLSLSPVRNVERMSGYNEDSYLLKLFKKFEKGIRKKNMFMMNAYKSFEHLTSSKEYEAAIYKDDGKEYTDIKGRKFYVSKMQMMQAILSYERELANSNLRHIEKGGFTFADLYMLRKGKLKEAVSAEHSHRVPSATAMVAEFQEILKDDKWCQDYMTVAREFFNKTAKDAINETSIVLKHRIIAKDKSYIPFEVDTNFVNLEITDMNAVQKTINGYGMLKDTQDHAPQPLYITGLNNILDRHIVQVGNVYGLAVEVRNFNKVWNVQSTDGLNKVKEMIETNWGKGGVEHIEQAVKDIQGSRVRERNALTAVYDRVKSGYISATFLLNLSVVTKQIGSLYSSTAMLKWRDPVRQIGNLIYTMANSKKISAEVDKYTASAWMRRQGVSDAELHTLMTERKKTWWGRLLAKTPAIASPAKWIAAMDHAVALSLWRYAKIDTKKKTELKGEELLKATAEFYDEVIENTQSMTDALHRPEIQKQNNIFAEAFAMFKTDLYQMAGQLHITAGRFFANKTKENGKALGRTLYAVAMSAIWGQLMTTVFALLRYKVKPYRDEEDEELTAESWMKRQGFGFAGDVIGYLFPILGSEVVGFFENIKYGESEDIAESLALTLINDLYDSMITIGTSIKDKEMPDLTDMRKLTAKVLQVFGVPANNILRIWDAIELHGKDIANGEFFSFEAGTDRSAKHHIHRIVEAVDRGRTDVAIGLFEEAIEELATKKADGGEYGEDEMKDAKSDLKAALGKKYRDGEISKDTTNIILTKLFGDSPEEVDGKIAYWDSRIDNPDSDSPSQWFITYYEKVESSGIDLDTYVKYRTLKKNLTTKEEILESIHSLGLSKEQKDALYLAEGYAESTLDETPWH